METSRTEKGKTMFIDGLAFAAGAVLFFMVGIPLLIGIARLIYHSMPVLLVAIFFATVWIGLKIWLDSLN